MFGRKLTPAEQMNKSQKRITRTIKKRDKLDKKHAQNPYAVPDYEEKRKKLNRQMAIDIEKKDAAKIQMKHPPKQQTTINTNLTLSKTDQSKSLHFHGHYHSTGKKKK